MAITNIPSVVPVDGSHAAPLGITDLNLSETAADVSNGNSVTLSTHEIVLLHNTDTVAHTVTIDSVPDALGREADIVSYSIPAGRIAAMSFLGALGAAGWKQTDGTLHINADSALVKIIVLKVNF